MDQAGEFGGERLQAIGAAAEWPRLAAATEAKRRTVAAPIPEVAPVTTTVRVLGSRVWDMAFSCGKQRKART